MAVLEAEAAAAEAAAEAAEGEENPALILCAAAEGEASLVGEWELARCRCDDEITPPDACDDGSGGLS